jgi:2-dehydropantoate 2-reductase
MRDADAFDHIIVLGAGAIGSVYAAKLSARHDVTLVGRAAHVDAITRDGLRILGCEEWTAHVRATSTIGEIAPRTLLLLTTKVNDSRRAIAAVAAALLDDTVILCVQNGLHSEAVVKTAIGERCAVLRAITQVGAIFKAPGVIDYTVAGYTLIEQGPQSQAIAALLTASGLDGRVSDQMTTEVWRKLIYNCVINPITSMLGTDVGGIADARLDPLKQLVVDECLQVARAEGVVFTIDFVRTIADVFSQSRTIASMRQDLLKGNSTEIDFMNGAVAELGRTHGIACPVNAALVAIIKAMEGARAGRAGGAG